MSPAPELEIEVRQATLADTEGMAAVERLAFPTMSEQELMGPQHFAAHQTVFAEGQFVAALQSGRVVGVTSTFRSRFPNERHTFLEATGGLWLSTHDPLGDWLYGFEMAVDPEFRGRGLARRFYAARDELCRTLRLSGQVIVGLPNGYGPISGEISIDDYLTEVVNGSRVDPTLSVQLKMGFTAQMVIPEHVNDQRCANFGILMSRKVSARGLESYRIKT